MKKKSKPRDDAANLEEQWLDPRVKQRLDARLKEWPLYRYEIIPSPRDGIRIIGPSNNILKPIEPEGSPFRTLEIYQVARECLLNNQSGHLVSPNEYRKLYAALHVGELQFRLRAFKGKIPGMCIICRRPLSGWQKFYCSDTCKNAEMKKRAHKRQHPFPCIDDDCFLRFKTRSTRDKHMREVHGD